MAEISKRALAIRRKQWIALGGVIAVVGLLSVVLAMWVQPESKPKTGAENQPKTKQLQLGSSSSDKDAWRVQTQADNDRLQKRLQKLEEGQQLREQRDAAEIVKAKQDAERAAQLAAQQAKAPIVPPPTPPAGVPPTGMFTQAGAQPARSRPTALVPPGGAPGVLPSAAIDGPGESTSDGIKTIQFTDDDAAPAPAPGPAGVRSDIVRGARQFGEENAKRTAAGKDGDSTRPATSSYVVAGSFSRAVLLNGLDAPTGGQNQNNPHPVLLRLIGPTRMANKALVDTNDCVATAAGTGDLSAERAYIRLDRIACVNSDGTAVDIKVSGYISGEDGKTGVRGRLVTKSGQVLANSLFTGILSSTGEVFKGQGISSSTSALGVQQSTVQEPVKVALGGGVGKAFDEMSKYYTRLADKMYPTVEVDGGRVVDIVFSQGFEIVGRVTHE